MATVQTEHDFETWRILLCARRGSELLVLKRPSGLCLPTLSIPRHERIAASLNEEAERLWKLETVCIRPLNIPHPDGSSGEARYHIMETPKEEDLSRIVPKTIDLPMLNPEAFSDVRDYLAVRRAMNLDDGDLSLAPKGPFSDFGTFQEISGWVQEQLEPFGRKWDGGFRQVQATDSFALIRFLTKDTAVWFKATGEPNQRELAITRCLSALFPRFTPETISSRNDWNAWLANEVEGKALDSGRDLSAWCCAAKSLAELQIASIGHVPSILGSGAHDSRTTKLLVQVAPFFAEIETLMQVQFKTPPRKLCASEIRVLGLQLTESFNHLDSLKIPDTLNHFDLNPANTIVCSGECKFLDWAEAAVGNPFYSFEFLRQHFLRLFGEEPEAVKNFRESYANGWRRLLPEYAIELAMEFMPLIAPFAFAVTTLPWIAAHRKVRPESAGFLRSLARRMLREAEQRTRAA